MYALSKSEQFAVIAMVKERDRIAEAYREAEEALDAYTKALAAACGITEECRLVMDNGRLQLVPVPAQEAGDATVTSE